MLVLEGSISRTNLLLPIRFHFRFLPLLLLKLSLHLRIPALFFGVSLYLGLSGSDFQTDFLDFDRNNIAYVCIRESVLLLLSDKPYKTREHVHFDLIFV